MSSNTDGNTVKKKRRPVPMVEGMDEDTVCGIGSFRPQWLQEWSTSRTFVVLYSITGILQGSQFAYLVGVLSTLEKRYSFNSKMSGIIVTLDEVMPVLLGILVGYFGGRSHRPRLIAIGMLLSVMNSFLCALPYFLYGPAENLMATEAQVNKEAVYCAANKTVERCGGDERNPTVVALVCIIFANLLKGFGNVAFYVVGTGFVDDTAKKKNTPLYFAFSLAMRLFGPIVGFLMSAWFLRYYENPLIDPGFGPDDPRWIGAWWLGFVLQGTLLLLLALPLLLFPRRLPRQRKRVVSDQKNFKEVVMGMFEAMGRLLRNPLYMWFALASIPSPVFMYFTVLPKYVENRFHLSTADASIFSGPLTVIALQIATLAGGYGIWKWRPTARQIAIASAIQHLMLLLAYIGLMYPSCKSRFNEGAITASGLNFENNCNINCDCNTNVMTPICGPDGETSYYSPCYAGCSVTFFEDNVQVFRNCSCTQGANPTQDVQNGFCLDNDCTKSLTIFISSLFFISIFTNFLFVAHEILLLRSMDPVDKTIGLGLFETLYSSLGFIPLPILYGSLIDSSCLVWEEKCGERGNCWYYDLDAYSRNIHGASAVLAGVSCFGFCVVARIASKFQPMYEDEGETKSTTNQSEMENIDNSNL